jgi:putative transposase
MSIRSVPFVPGEFFHIYNRGTDKRTIFFDYADHHRFLELLYLCNSEKQINVRDVKSSHESVFDFERDEMLVSIGAYCLMPNHFHLLLTPQTDGAISKYMNKVSTGYSMYFNKRYMRTGALFQGKFKAEHADTDEYLKYLYAYIHLNPVKLIDSTWREEGVKDAAKSFDFTASFQYSSLPDYLGQKREENKIIDPKPFPEYFLTQDDIKKEIFEWLTYNENHLP